MNEDYWYYEERDHDGLWMDAFTGYRLTREEAIERMERRKREYPRAVLRLVHCVKTRVSYAKRRSA